ncbi:hypothetical protein BGZ54_010569 [Gamsiella multidivaricata]|nr:hypothetical protein BGZ54_010569 [Gamsiella multidivaricata]
MVRASLIDTEEDQRDLVMNSTTRQERTTDDNIRPTNIMLYLEVNGEIFGRVNIRTAVDVDGFMLHAAFLRSIRTGSLITIRNESLPDTTIKQPF